MSERPPNLPDWPEQWEIVTGYRPGTFWRCVRCGTEVAPAHRCYELNGEWQAETTTMCPNGCAEEDKRREMTP